MQMEQRHSSNEKYEGSILHLNHGMSSNNSSDQSGFILVWQDSKQFAYPCIFLLTLTALGNVLIIAVFVRKRMRTTTNLILLFIAISDSLTGCATMPAFIHLFSKETESWVSVNEGWCEAFMIFKLYISKAFHTVSIWLTLLLGFQRFICVWFPFKAKCWFSTRRTLIAVAVINISAFLIHIYHLNQRKADKEFGICHWDIEDPCVETCTFLLTTLILVVILPSMILLLLTILIILKLFHRNILNESFSADQIRMRDQQNKRASVIVVCIAIIFLISEIPYGFILLVTVRKKHNAIFSLFYNIYDMVLLTSFHANFWVYIILNTRFREDLISIFRDGISKIATKAYHRPQ